MFTIRRIPFTATDHTYEVLIPLYGFGLDVDQVKLSEWDSLEKYSLESFRTLLEDWQEFRDFLRVFPPDYILRVCFHDQNEYLIFTPGEDPLSGSGVWLREDQEGVKAWIDDILIAFRLFKKGFFVSGGKWLIATGTLTHNGQMVKVAATSCRVNEDTTAGSLIKSNGEGYCYYLDSTEIRAFCTFRDRIEQELEQVRLVPRMAVALDHLMSCYSVRRPTTHVIDLFICLEALLKSRNDTSKRLNERVANVVSNSASQTAKLLERVQEFYKLRCAIVHGDALQAEQELLLDHVGELRELVRNVFRFATDIGAKVGYGPQYYSKVHELAGNVFLKKEFIQDGLRTTTVTQ